MSINERIQDVAKNAASASSPSGGAGWIPAALKVGAVLLTVALSAVGAGEAAEAAESLSEIGRK